jgi:hypothetical protein
VPGSATCPQIQIGKPTLPEHGAIASQPGDGDRERLLQTSKTGEGRAPVPSAELEPGDGGLAAIPADDLPGERVGLGRPGDSQLITSRPNNAEGIATRAGGTALGAAGRASMPATTGCWLTAHADASDPSDDPSPANLFAGSSSRRPQAAPAAPARPEPSLRTRSAQPLEVTRVTALPNGLVSRRNRISAPPVVRATGSSSNRKAIPARGGSGRCGLQVRAVDAEGDVEDPRRRRVLRPSKRFRDPELPDGPEVGVDL